MRGVLTLRSTTPVGSGTVKLKYGPATGFEPPSTCGFAGAVIGLLGVQLAMQSGEGLEEILNEKDALIEKHSQLAEQALRDLLQA